VSGPGMAGAQAVNTNMTRAVIQRLLMIPPLKYKSLTKTYFIKYTPISSALASGGKFATHLYSHICLLRKSKLWSLRKIKICFTLLFAHILFDVSHYAE